MQFIHSVGKWLIYSVYHEYKSEEASAGRTIYAINLNIFLLMS